MDRQREDALEPTTRQGSQSESNRRMWLSDLPTGTKAVICCLGGGKWLSARAAALGFTPGAEVTVLQNYGHGPVIVMVRGARIALGRGEARKIQVEV